MSGYTELQQMGVLFRPIDEWPGTLTADRRRAPFSAVLGSTLKELARELAAVDAHDVIVQVALSDADIRLDGLPRSKATAAHPGIIIAFQSKFGPLKFAVDTFKTWEHNLRAIALGMEALRKVDRYGVTKRGEQYTGWKALPVSTDPADAIQTREQAQAYLDDVWDGDVKRALLETHPDRGGDPDEFRKVQRARELTA